MAAQQNTLPDVNSLDMEAPRALVVEQHAAILSRNTEIDNLKLLVLKLKRMHFGHKSEKLGRAIDQLELRLEDLEAAAAPTPALAPADAPAAETTPQKPARRPLPESLPRSTETHAPRHTVCPDCGGKLRALGEDVSEILEYVPGHFEVIRLVRPKLSCTYCEHIVQEPAPSRPIDRGLAGPGLLAHVIVSKYSDHLPLYRQSEIYEREGIDLDRSTLAGWVGGASDALAPLVEQLRRFVMSAGKLHGDDTPVPVLAPGNGKTKTGRLWTYVRDDRPAGDDAAPAVWFAYSPDRKGEHPERHLRDFRGTLQTDGYAGFNRIYEKGLVEEAACWAHVRRKFYDLHQAHASPLAAEAMARIGQLYAIEKEIRDRDPDARREVRLTRSRLLIESLHEWMQDNLAKLSAKSDTASAIRYALGRWTALTRYCDDGRLEIDNNAVYAASGIDRVMPRSGLCRVGREAGRRYGWISDSPAEAKRHNQRLSRNASKGSAGRKRSGTAPDGVACARARSLSCMSAWR